MFSISSDASKYDEKSKILTAPKRKLELDTSLGAGHYFWTALKKNGTRIAQIDAVTGETDSYASLLQRSIRTAIELKNRGVKPGDIVASCTYNHLNSIVPYIASQLIGAIFTAVDVTIQLDDTAYLLNLAKPKIIFVSANVETLIQAACNEANLHEYMEIISFSKSDKFVDFDQFICEQLGEDEFQVYIPEDTNVTTNILFSSGTTGLPKGICLNISGLLSSVAYFDFLEQDDVFLSYASLYWISTYFLINMAFHNGGSRLICPAFSPVYFWSYIQKYKVTFAFFDPTQVIKCVANIPKEYSYNLKYLLLGGSALPSKYFNEVSTVFSQTNMIVVYAQTEAGLVCVMSNASKLPKEKQTSCGFLVDGLQCKIVNSETDESVGPNEVGEIRIKNNTRMNGYYNMDASDCWDKDDFLKTGDLGYYDQDFSFYITDRLKEMFKYLAWHIVPAKIEKILVLHPDVEHGIVVGIPHPEDSNHAMAIVTIKKESKVTAEEIEIWMENQLDDRHKLRAGVRIVEAMIYTPTGKIRRKEMRDKILQANK